MANMSYCRFQNTKRDLVDCYEALQELADGQQEPLSEDELQAARGLVETAFDIVEFLCNQELSRGVEALAESEDPVALLTEALDTVQVAAEEARE